MMTKPPLPASNWSLWCHNAYEEPYYSHQDGYTEEDMHAYAAAAVAAERERCARAVEQYGGAWDVTTQNFARVIRGLT